MPTIQEVTDAMLVSVPAPEPWGLEDDLDQTEYLVDGEIRHHDGPMQLVMPCLQMAEVGLDLFAIGHYPLLSTEEAMQALDAAVRAYDSGRGLWPTLSVGERIGYMERFVVAMKATREEVIRLLMWEIGKNLRDSTKEFDRTVEYIVDTLEALKELDRTSSRFQITQGIAGQVRRAPLGVVLCMGPYNYPLNETFTTLIPALLMGNTVVFKPPRLGVLLHRPLLKAFAEVFPPGVVNTVYGDGREVVGPLLATGKVDCLAFIGSSRVADILKSQHPKPHRLRCVLGLEAKNLAIVLPDADLDNAVKECVLGSLSYNGQRCTALKLLHVHRSIADEFAQRMAQAIDKLPYGAPWTPGAELTPLPDLDHARLMETLVDNAIKQGAKLSNNGGFRVGNYFQPAFLTGVDASMRLYHEEQFGPVVPMATFDDIETPIRTVVESNFGQQVSLFGSDPQTLARLIDPLVNQVCRVNINCQCQRGPDTFPFTGRKDSAEGTLSISDALRVFSIRTLVASKLSDQNKAILTEITHNRLSNFLSTDFIL